MKFPRPSEQILPDKIKCTSPPGFSQSTSETDRIIGSLVGLATGDALGASVEFRPHQYFIDHPVRDMKGGGTWGLKAGQWTDDTSMALCLASSLIGKKEYNPYDQMVRYKWWFKFGYMSSTGRCFDIGNATRDSLEEFSRRQKILFKQFQCSREDDVDNLSWNNVQSVKEFKIDCSSSGVAGNGALMRLTPVPLFFYRFPAIAVEYAGLSARLTHGDKKAVDACRYYAALIVAAVNGVRKSELLRPDFYESHREWFGSVVLHDEVLRVAKGSYKRPNGYDDGIRGKGYIVNALEAALWAFWIDDNSFEKGALAAVNLGDDTDTTAAIYGQLAGAVYGYQNIPEKWLKTLYAHKLLVCIGQWLYYEGNQYKLTENEQKMIPESQASNSSSLNQYQKLSNPQLSTYRPDAYQSPPQHSNVSEVRVHQIDDKQSSTYQRGTPQASSYNPDVSQSRMHRSDDKHLSTFQSGASHSPVHYADSSQSRMRQSENNYLSMYGAGTYQPSAYNSDVSQSSGQQFSRQRLGATQSIPSRIERDCSLETSIRPSYGTGQTGIQSLRDTTHLVYDNIPTQTFGSSAYNHTGLTNTFNYANPVTSYSMESRRPVSSSSRDTISNLNDRRYIGPSYPYPTRYY